MDLKLCNRKSSCQRFVKICLYRGGGKGSGFYFRGKEPAGPKIQSTPAGNVGLTPLPTDILSFSQLPGGGFLSPTQKVRTQENTVSQGFQSSG